MLRYTRFIAILLGSLTISGSNALAASEDILSVDKTVFIQVIIFIAAIFILNKLVFRPFMDVIDRREKLTEGALQEARELDEKVRNIIEAYEARLAKAREQATEERNNLVRDGEAIANGLTARAREETASLLEDAKSRLKAETEEIKKRIDSDVEVLAKDVASKVLGREVNGSW